MRHPVGIIGIAFVVFVVSCGPGQGPGQAPAASSSQPAPSRTLVVGHRIEPSSLAPKVLGTNGLDSASAERTAGAVLKYSEDLQTVRAAGFGGLADGDE